MPNPAQVVVRSTVARQCVWQGYGAQLVENRNEFLPAYLGTDEGMDPGGNDVTIIDPLGSKVFDGSQDYWARTADGTAAPVVLISTPSALSTQISPAEVAAQLAISGVPPTDNPAALVGGVMFNTLIAAGATLVIGPLSVKSYNSVFGKMFATATSSGIGNAALAYPQIEFDWSVASDNFDPLRSEAWFPAETPFNFTYNYVNQWASPCYGDSLKVSVTNNDTNPVNWTMGLFGSYRTRIRSTMRGLYQTVPTPGDGLGSDNVVAFLNWANIPIADFYPGGVAPAGQLANLWEGPVTVAMNVPGNSKPGLLLFIQPQPGGSFPTQPNYQLEADTSGTIQPATIILPRRACLVYVANNTGVIVNAGQVTITGQVQPE